MYGLVSVFFLAVDVSSVACTGVNGCVSETMLFHIDCDVELALLNFAVSESLLEVACVQSRTGRQCHLSMVFSLQQECTRP